MNKNGLTLVELLAVITIVAILAVIVTPGVLSLRSNILENTLKSKKAFIENAAKDYAQEHITELKSHVTNTYNGTKEADDENCIYRTVNYLLNNGYITSNNSYINTKEEADNRIINPVTGEVMNNNRICIRFSNDDVLNREIITYLVEE